MMRSKVSKRIISVLLAFVMVAGLIPAATVPVRAQNVIGLINASGIRANEGVVLYGDTTLNMDTDLTVPSIEGDYNLTVQGSGRLTVNGGGRIRSNDLTAAYDHVSGEETILDDYIFRCADIDGSGRIRSNDVTKMYDHTTGDEPLW